MTEPTRTDFMIPQGYESFTEGQIVGIQRSDAPLEKRVIISVSPLKNGSQSIEFGPDMLLGEGLSEAAINRTTEQ